MSSQDEMRRVMLHAANNLRKSVNNHIGVPDDIQMATAYAAGVLDLLASYLKVEDGDAASTNGKPPATQPSDMPPPTPQSWTNTEKVERNAQIVAAVTAGENAWDVAQQFGISSSRVRHIVSTARKQGGSEAS